MKTAVEWLENELNVVRLDVDKSVLKFIDKSIKQAKEMEKQQIIEAYLSDRFPCSYEDAEQYYNETFNK